jgi:excisionase family DNA binding protein
LCLLSLDVIYVNQVNYIDCISMIIWQVKGNLGGFVLTKKLVVTICEAAAAISVSELTMRRKIWRGEVRAKRVGGRIFIPVDEVRRLVGLLSKR